MVSKICSALVGAALMGTTSLAGVIPIDEIWEPAGEYPRDAYVKIAMVAVSPSGIAPLTQDKAVVERYKQQNRDMLKEYVREAAASGAEMILTPEFGIVGYPDQPDLPDEEDNFKSPDEIRPYAEESDGESFRQFSALAKELGVYIHYGLVIPGEGPDDFYNAIQVVGPDGSLVAEYYKISLFELENNFLIPGERGVTYESPIGTVGLIVCSDVYSEKALKWYRDNVQLLALSTSWARYNSGMSAFRRAAMDLNVNLAAANQMYFPDSGMINPDGTFQSHIRQSSGVAYGYMPRVNN